MLAGQSRAVPLTIPTGADRRHPSLPSCRNGIDEPFMREARFWLASPSDQRERHLDRHPDGYRRTILLAWVEEPLLDRAHGLRVQPVLRV